MGTVEQMQGVYSSMSAQYMSMAPHLLENRTAYGILNRDLCMGPMSLGNGCSAYPSQTLQPVSAPSFKEAAWQLHEVTRQMQQLARQLSDARQQQAQHSASFHVLLKDLVSTQKQQHTALESLRSLQVETDLLQPSPQALPGSQDVIHVLSQELQYYKHLAQEQQHNPKVLQLQSQLDATQHELAATQQLNSRLIHERGTLVMRLQQLMHQLVTLQDRPQRPDTRGMDSLEGAIASLDGVIASKLNELTHQMAGLCVELADETGGLQSDAGDANPSTFDGVRQERVRSEDGDRLLQDRRKNERVALSEQGTSTDDLVDETERTGVQMVVADVCERSEGIELEGERGEGHSQAEVASLQLELKQSMAQLDVSQEQLLESEQKLQAVQAKLRQQEDTSKELQEARQQLQALLQEKKDVVAKVTSLEDQLREQHQLKQELITAQQRADQLKRELQDAEEAKQKLQTLTQQLDEQQQAQAQIQETNKQLQEAHQKLQETNKQLQQSHAHLQQQLDAALTDLKSKQTESEKLKADITMLKQKAEKNAVISQPDTESSRALNDQPTIDPSLPMLMAPELLPSPSPTFHTTKTQRLGTLKARRTSGDGEDTPTSLSGTVTPVGRGGPMEVSSSLLLANSQLEALKRQRDEAESKLQSLLGLIQQAMAQEISNAPESEQGTSKITELAALQKLCAALTPASCVRSSAAVLTQRSSQLQATMQAALAEIKSLRAELTADVTDGPILDPQMEMGPSGKTLLASIQEIIPPGELETSSSASELPPPPEGIPSEWAELYYKDTKKFNELWQEARASADVSGSLWPKQEPQELPLLDQLGSLPPATSAVHMENMDDHYDVHAVVNAADVSNGHHNSAPVPDPSKLPPPPPGLPDDLVALYYELGPDMFFQLLNDAQQEAHT